MDENGEISTGAAQSLAAASSQQAPSTNLPDEGIDMNTSTPQQKTVEEGAAADPFMNGEIRTLDGDIAGDEFAADAINYQILLGKIDALLERLKLDA